MTGTTKSVKKHDLVAALVLAALAPVWRDLRNTRSR
jgi:hypothetical protein